MQKNSQFKTQL